jgi:tetratricopeptide (TPR) repeat protein
VPTPPRRPDRPNRPDRPDRPDRRPQRPTGRSGPARAGRPERASRPDAPTAPRSPRRDGADDAPRRPRLAEPELPADIDPRELDRDARAELRSLPESLAERVAVHLIAAGRAIDDDPALARRHAWYARSLAPRLAIVREAAGVTAYADGDFAAALAELRAVRRMTGDPAQLPLLADCERGLGRPDRALALGRDPDVKKLEPAARVELAIVLSGARRDRKEYDAAVVGLQGPALDDPQVQPWTVRLWYAYADALLDAGRVGEARRWFESVVDIDDEEETDAVERLAALPAD